MAHIQKYKADAIKRMCGHYDRWGMDIDKSALREHIDSSLTHLNWNAAPPRRSSQAAFIDRRIASLGKVRIRKDSVRMADCVLTMPKSLDPAMTEDFFRAGYAFLADRYGHENVVSAWVHMDEPGAQPHMHFAWVPVTPDGRLSAKDVLSRKDLRTLHGDMQAALEDRLGCRVEVLLDPDKIDEKSLSKLSHDKFVEYTKKVGTLKDEISNLESAVAEAENRKTEAEKAAEEAEYRSEYLQRQNRTREEVIEEIPNIRRLLMEEYGGGESADRDVRGIRDALAECETALGEGKIRSGAIPGLDDIASAADSERSRISAAEEAIASVADLADRLRVWWRALSQKIRIRLTPVREEAVPEPEPSSLIVRENSYPPSEVVEPEPEPWAEEPEPEPTAPPSLASKFDQIMGGPARQRGHRQRDDGAR